MVQGNAAVSSASIHGIPPDIHALGVTPRTDLPTLTGARRSFEGLIANRGRKAAARAAAAGAARARNLAVVPAVSATALKVGVAESSEQIEAANRLICRRYAWRGYNLEAFECRSPAPATEASLSEITFFAADPETTLGTITLRLDGPDGLKADATHGESMTKARGGNRRLAELTRLALAEGADSRTVLASLFGLVYAVGRLVHGVTDVFIEVNPRHVVFYARALGFVVIGETRFCERVGAPSVLLHLDVACLDESLGLGNTVAAEEPIQRYGT
jgi:hypothetical protein